MYRLSHASSPSIGLDVEYHAPGPAHRQCLAATRNSNYYEIALVHPNCQNTQPPVYAGDYSDMLGAINADGPGLGVEYDWDEILTRETGRRVYE